MSSCVLFANKDRDSLKDFHQELSRFFLFGSRYSDYQETVCNVVADNSKAKIRMKGYHEQFKQFQKLWNGANNDFNTAESNKEK